MFVEGNVCFVVKRAQDQHAPRHKASAGLCIICSHGLWLSSRPMTIHKSSLNAVGGSLFASQTFNERSLFKH